MEKRETPKLQPHVRVYRQLKKNYKETKAHERKSTKEMTKAVGKVFLE